MIRIEIKGLDGVVKALQDLRTEKIPSATRNAINDTAFGLKSHLQDLMKSTLKNPHPSTVKNIFVVKATNQTLAARVRYDQLYRRGIDEYMLPLIEGGSRTMKPSEKRFNSFLMPAYRVNPQILNKYGNIQGGKMMQMLSRLKLMETYAGSAQNETAKSRGKRTGGKKSVEYFMIKPGQTKGGLKPGVYQRTAKQGGFTSHGAPRAMKGRVGAFQKGTASTITARGALPMVTFTRQQHYRPILPFFTSGLAYVNKHLPENISKQIQLYINKGFGR